MSIRPTFARRSGFTLIELLVVIAIIGILATIITASLAGARQKANDAKRIADLRTIQLALALYYNDNNFYPVNIYASSNAFTPPNPRNGLLGAYLSVVPTDPTGDGCAANSNRSLYCYTALTSSASLQCNGTVSIPNRYHLGVRFQSPNAAALGTDVDQNSSGVTLGGQLTGFSRCTGTLTDGFNGNNAACSTGADDTDLCYDLLPN